MKRWNSALMILVALAVLVAPATAEESATSISGYYFGDAYWMAANHDSEIESSNGFWFRRIYVSADRKFDDSFSSRVRLEMNSPGDFTSSSKLTPAVKDAYLKWKKGRHSVVLGISGTPTWGVLEKGWGYRAVEKTPLDLQKWGSSRDFGVAVKGALDAGKNIRYHVMLGNGNSNKSETNDGKKAMAALGFYPNENVIIEGYVDYDNRDGVKDRATYQGFAMYEGANVRFGGQYAHQERENGEDVAKTKLDLFSGFAVVEVAEKLNVFGRVDVMNDPNPDAAKISYLPFATDAKATFVVFGLDFEASEDVNIMPNIEFVKYTSELDGVDDPDSDVMGRITTYVRF